MKEDNFPVASENSLDEKYSTDLGRTKIGRKLNNPFTVENMQKAIII